MVLAAAGCKPKEEGAERAPVHPLVSGGEMARAHAACLDYKTQVCAKAKTTSTFAEPCRLADTRIAGLDLHEKALTGAGDMSPEDQAVIHTELRRTAKACIEDAGKLRSMSP